MPEYRAPTAMDLLCQLQAIPGPSGDEGRIAEFVAAWCRQIPGTQVDVIHDLVLAQRGQPQVAVFAHTDTIGFTQGYGRELIAIGGPKVEGGERLRNCVTGAEARLEIHHHGDRPDWRLSRKLGEPGDRWVYAPALKVRKGEVSGPYLDNRAGVWNGLRVLERVADVAVVFSTGEEHSGRGAALGARLIHELGVGQALISDITWHTRGVRLGRGPAISHRDRSLPRQAFLQRVVQLAAISAVPHQQEVESGGGSDGSVIERSSYPIDWVFIGAPQKRPHTPREVCRVSDLEAMVHLYAHLIPALSEHAG